ncbi:acyltransferase family-domain-containing protein [Dactylonectria macrodidyma]|uniref:Acyltransferase family-domain-containing protein n=1 Tax=Dactylonectria macrodidyma TaxID=307937 RepID=A0A9P9E5H5_9HYPO|nr:acyltransferase family-domain-containing protein [Dactylonectria macrodidyma]
MSSPRMGILNGQDWDEVKPILGSGWKPVTSVRYCSNNLRRIKGSFWPKAPPTTDKIRPTAYLDGLRGFAAFLVYWQHHELLVHDWGATQGAFENSFGYEGKYYFAAFYGIRHFFTGGHFAVATFFIISGYVLSMKPLSLIQAGEYVQLGDNLASALFRRWIRLYLPIIAVVSLTLTIWYTFGIWVRPLEMKSSLWAELWAFYLEFKNFSFAYKEGGEPWLSYNRHLWSIPAEFRGSMVIYASLMAFSRCSRNARLLCQVGLIYYFMYISDGWYCATAVAGMLLCDLDLLAKKGELPRFLARLEPIKTFIYYHLFAVAMFLGGVPSQTSKVEQLAKNRGWYYLSYLKPQAVFDYKWFYLFWAAVFLVSSVQRIHWLKSFFETRFCQYLGRISYGLYLVHGPVLWTVGDRLFCATGWVVEEHLQHIPNWANKLAMPKMGPVGLEISFLLPHVILLPLTLGLADAVTRFIDTPSVKFASWLYAKTQAGLPSEKLRNTKT